VAFSQKESRDGQPQFWSVLVVPTLRLRTSRAHHGVHGFGLDSLDQTLPFTATKRAFCGGKTCGEAPALSSSTDLSDWKAFVILFCTKGVMVSLLGKGVEEREERRRFQNSYGRVAPDSRSVAQAIRVCA